MDNKIVVWQFIDQNIINKSNEFFGNRIKLLKKWIPYGISIGSALDVQMLFNRWMFTRLIIDINNIGWSPALTIDNLNNWLNRMTVKWPLARRDTQREAHCQQSSTACKIAGGCMRGDKRRCCSLYCRRSASFVFLLLWRAPGRANWAPQRAGVDRDREYWRRGACVPAWRHGCWDAWRHSAQPALLPR